MTTYSAVAGSEIDSDSPITDTLMGKLASNPLAIAEADASVPATLLPTVLLGTLTTTSGSTQTLSSLTLTPYKMLLFVWNGVSTTTTGATLNVGSANVVDSIASSATLTVSGFVWVELSSGLALGVTLAGGGSSPIRTGASGYSTASTSVSVSTGGTFDAGTVRVYGCK